MDPATLTMLTLGMSAAGAASSLLGPKPKTPSAPPPLQKPIPDSSQSPQSSFLSNAAVAPAASQTGGSGMGGKSLLGQ